MFIGIKRSYSFYFSSLTEFLGSLIWFIGPQSVSAFYASSTKSWVLWYLSYLWVKNVIEQNDHLFVSDFEASSIFKLFNTIYLTSVSFSTNHLIYWIERSVSFHILMVVIYVIKQNSGLFIQILMLVFLLDSSLIFVWYKSISGLKVAYRKSGVHCYLSFDWENKFVAALS